MSAWRFSCFKWQPDSCSGVLPAATELARHGVKSTVLDENPRIGGAIYRQPQRPPSPGEKGKEDADRAAALFRAFAEHGDRIELLSHTEVLGALDGERQLSLLRKGRLASISFDRLIVCTGCQERAQPFPGWTLPGVMTVGGAQLQVKSGLVRPGKTAVLVGTGPLLLVAAVNLHQAGVHVAGVFEAGRRADLLRSLPDLFSGLPLLREGMALMRYLKRHRIPLRFGWGIVEARANRSGASGSPGPQDEGGELHQVVVAPYDAAWRPRRERALTLLADCLGVGYGYVPRTQLAQLLGCKLIHDGFAGGVLPERDEWLRTSRKEVSIAGDAAGVFGSQTAAAEGRIAALGCALDLGRITGEVATAAAAPARDEVKRLRRFRRAFERFSDLRQGLLELPADDTVVCRCERVTFGELRQAVERGIETLTALKMATRIGMGDCQGKICGSFCAEYLSAKTQTEPARIGGLRPRFPLSPIPFQSVLEEEAKPL